MRSTAGTPDDHAPINRLLSFAAAIVVAALSVTALAVSQAVARPVVPGTGFAQPFAGTPKYEKFAPTEATSARQVSGRWE